MIRIIHILNQFFAGIGGEEKADIAVAVADGTIGAARGLQTQLAERGQVTATLYFGDNYFHEHRDQALAAILAEVEKQKPDAIVAGPAFNAGRYGLACVEICQTVSEKLGLRCVTAMEPENPGVAVYRDYHNDKVFLLPTAETASGMARALSALAPFVCRLANGEEIGPACRRGLFAARHSPAGARRQDRRRSRYRNVTRQDRR
jgi:glycine reductase